MCVCMYMTPRCRRRLRRRPCLWSRSPPRETLENQLYPEYRYIYIYIYTCKYIYKYINIYICNAPATAASKSPLSALTVMAASTRPSISRSASGLFHMSALLNSTYRRRIQRNRFIRGHSLVVTRYCHWQYCMMYGIQTGGRGGRRILD